ncbi:hypothetical protein J3R83DRAFT_8085 [Lanmaoa asiatica]|nr:hypothetical protein J3R83DRAFT_8085 [Lanmaoa asiatica]
MNDLSSPRTFYLHDHFVVVEDGVRRRSPRTVMLGGQSVRVTYAHKRRRVQNASKKLFSSPLEVLPPEMDDLTRSQMARRMLKRSRRVTLAEQLEDKNIEHIREHLAKRIKHTQERVSNVELTGVPFDMPPQDDTTFQTPFPSSQSVHEPAVAKPLVPGQLSPVPVAKRVMSRTSSRNLKENSAHSQTLASPFSSRPGSAASSPKHKGRGRSSRRVSRNSFHAKSRTLSGVFKENTRRVSRKDSTMSLKDTNGEPPAKHIKHQRYPSSPSTSYMRPQFAQEDWIAPPKALYRTLYDRDEIPSSDGSAHSNASFYTDQPQACSTPAMSRLQQLPDLHGPRNRTDNRLTSFSLRKDSTEAGDLDVEMMDGTVPSQRQTIHLSGNSIFSSSDEFTIESLPAVNNVAGRDEAPARAAGRKILDRSQAGHTLAGSFIAEYDIPLSCSPASTAATKILGPEGIPKLSVGERPFDLPGSSPARGKSLIIRKSRNPGPVIPPASPPRTTTCPPSSPASDLVLELRSMDIHGCFYTSSFGFASSDTSVSIVTVPLNKVIRTRTQTEKHVVYLPLSLSRRVRILCRTLSPSPSQPQGSLVAPGASDPLQSNVRRTRSGTVVGPDSKLASKGAGSPGRVVKGAPATRLAAVQSGSESESDDELLLKGPWIEDLEYLGLAVPPDRKDSEADEMNLGGLWHGLEFGPSRRPGLRRR